VEAARSVNVLAPLAGRITMLNVAPGDLVRRGQVLAQLTSGDMAQALSDDAKARSALNLAQRQYQRAQGVLKAGGAAVKDIEAARSNFEQAQAEAVRAAARLDALQIGGATDQRGTLKLIAPIDGRISTLTVSAGTTVTDPTMVLMTIVDDSEVWVVGNVPEDQARLVQQGQAVDMVLPALPDTVLHGTIAAVVPVLRPDTRRMDARIVVPNDKGLLRPGMYATATIAVPEETTLALPQSALLMNNDSTTVFVEVAPGTFERRKVEISYDEAQDTRILSGLAATDKVVVRGGVLLNDD
jgi:cobalt-zinc-cadmium efflux system membrane fusion protein